jgi:thiol-disulfide isomerase/thioredoxin
VLVSSGWGSVPDQHVSRTAPADRSLLAVLAVLAIPPAERTCAVASPRSSHDTFRAAHLRRPAVPVTSPPTPLGTPLPDRSLRDAVDEAHDLHSLAAGAPLLVAFVCNHCPYVRHIETALGAFAREYATRGLSIVGIMANDVDSHPEDGPDGMREQSARAGWDFPVLVDPEQVVALELGAACTPDLFLFDAAGALVHRGAFDGSTPGNGVPVDGSALRVAVDAVLAGAPVPADLPPAIGCGIKWSPGNEPS